MALAPTAVEEGGTAEEEFVVPNELYSTVVVPY